MHPKTAERMVRENDPESLEQLLDFVLWRLEHGWTPEVSTAAWIVAAVRDGYEVPEAFIRARREGEKEARRAANEVKRMQRELEEQRRERLRKAGVSDEDDRLWRAVLSRLRERGQWSPMLPAAMMRRTGRSTCEIIVPWGQFVRKVEEKRKEIEKALSELSGEQVKVKVVCRAEN